MLKEMKRAQKIRIHAHCGTTSVQYMTTREMALYSFARTYPAPVSTDVEKKKSGDRTTYGNPQVPVGPTQGKGKSGIDEAASIVGEGAGNGNQRGQFSKRLPVGTLVCLVNRSPWGRRFSYITKKTMIPTSEKLMRIPAGPARRRAFPEPTRRPGPMMPEGVR